VTKPEEQERMPRRQHGPTAKIRIQSTMTSSGKLFQENEVEVEELLRIMSQGRGYYEEYSPLAFLSYKKTKWKLETTIQEDKIIMRGKTPKARVIQ
jgi:hypothetical protein